MFSSNSNGPTGSGGYSGSSQANSGPSGGYTGSSQTGGGYTGSTQSSSNSYQAPSSSYGSSSGSQQTGHTHYGRSYNPTTFNNQQRQSGYSSDVGYQQVGPDACKCCTIL